MNKIRVMHVVYRMNKGGAETMLMNLFRHIDRDNYQFYFLCVNSEREFDYQLEINRLGGKIVFIKSLKNPLTMKKIFQKNQIDIVHSHVQLASGVVMLAAKIAGVKHRIAHSHSTSSGRRNGFVTNVYEFIAKKMIIKHSTKLVSCGGAAGRYLFDEHEFSILKNGISLSTFEFLIKNRERVRRDWGVSDDVFLLGAVGRLSQEKNHIFLLDVLTKLNHHNVQLVVAGDGPLKNKLLESIKAKGLTGRVKLLGLVDDIGKIYSGFDMFVMPSLYEGLPLSLIEAQASGLACLCSSGVDPESDISGRVVFLDIYNPLIWSHNIAEYKNTVSAPKYRCDKKVLRKIYQSGYNIQDVVRKLELLYKQELITHD